MRSASLGRREEDILPHGTGTVPIQRVLGSRGRGPDLQELKEIKAPVWRTPSQPPVWLIPSCHELTTPGASEDEECVCARGCLGLVSTCMLGSHLALPFCCVHLERGCTGTEAPERKAVCCVFEIARAVSFCPILSSQSCQTGGGRELGLGQELHPLLASWWFSEGSPCLRSVLSNHREGPALSTQALPNHPSALLLGLWTPGLPFQSANPRSAALPPDYPLLLWRLD